MTYTIVVYAVKTPDDAQKNCPKHVEFYSKNKFEKLVHLVCFSTRIYPDARSSERQTQVIVLYNRTLHISPGDSWNIWWFVSLANAANYSALLKRKTFECNKLKLIETASSS